MVKWYSKITFLCCIVTTQQTSFGMITANDRLQIASNIELAFVNTIIPSISLLFESDVANNAKTTIAHSKSINVQLNALKSLINPFKRIALIVFLQTPQIMHTCFTTVKRMNLPVPLFRYLPDTFAVSPMAINVGFATLLNPFLLEYETKHYLASKFIIQFLFCVAAQNNPILNNKYNAFNFNQISKEISPQSSWITHSMCFLLLLPKCTQAICTKASKKLKPKSKKMAKYVKSIPTYLDQLFQARQYIWLTLAILSCLGIQGTQNRILYDWKYWLLVGGAHATWVNMMVIDKNNRGPAEQLLQISWLKAHCYKPENLNDDPQQAPYRFFVDNQTIKIYNPRTQAIWRRYAFLLGSFWIPITAATAATFYEAQCAKTG